MTDKKKTKSERIADLEARIAELEAWVRDRDAADEAERWGMDL